MNWLNSNMHTDDSDSDLLSESSAHDTHSYTCATCDVKLNDKTTDMRCPDCRRKWTIYDALHPKKCGTLDVIAKRNLEIKFSTKKKKKDHRAQRHALNWIGTNILGNLGNVDETFDELHLARSTGDPSMESMRAQRRFGMPVEHLESFHPTHPSIIACLPKLDTSDDKQHVLLKERVCSICQVELVDEDTTQTGHQNKDSNCTLQLYEHPQASDDKAVSTCDANVVVEHKDASDDDEDDGIATADSMSVVRLWCGHFFHYECVIPWLRKSNTCPLCRYELPSHNHIYELKKRKETYSDAIHQVMT